MPDPNGNYQARHFGYRKGAEAFKDEPLLRAEDVAHVPEIINNYDDLAPSKESPDSVILWKQYGEWRQYVIVSVSGNMLNLKTTYYGK